uniref:NADH dehydrogenase subunit 6 n=1 Tax=Orosius sp. TaxID=2974349 RepID=UPI0021823D72|nr:NADH dehydrogenase subunit 6 [Orosius sp.]UVI59883.1 NADH dehydrogenase subunit 6 [Orosius sp.]
MKMMVMKCMMAISMVTFSMKTPMSLGVLLLMMTTLSTILISLIAASAWMPMIMFLMLIGGLLILFMYMSSIASNEKFNSNIKLLFLSMFIFILPYENLMSEFINNELLESTMTLESISMIKIYNKKTFMITIMLFLYLLLSMIVVTKITKIFKGPLRSK